MTFHVFPLPLFSKYLFTTEFTEKKFCLIEAKEEHRLIFSFLEFVFVYRDLPIDEKEIPLRVLRASRERSERVVKNIFYIK